MLTTVVEHHANLLPWRRYSRQRFVECRADGALELEAVVEGLDLQPKPVLLAITGASNVTGHLPPIDAIIAAARARRAGTARCCAAGAAHRALPAEADFVVFSGHKLYAPFGAGALIGPRGCLRAR